MVRDKTSMVAIQRSISGVADCRPKRPPMKRELNQR